MTKQFALRISMSDLRDFHANSNGCRNACEIESIFYVLNWSFPARWVSHVLLVDTNFFLQLLLLPRYVHTSYENQHKKSDNSVGPVQLASLLSATGNYYAMLIGLDRFRARSVGKPRAQANKLCQSPKDVAMCLPAWLFICHTHYGHRPQEHGKELGIINLQVY